MEAVFLLLIHRFFYQAPVILLIKAFAKNKIAHLLGHVLRSFELFTSFTDAFGLRALRWFSAIAKSRPTVGFGNPTGAVGIVIFFDMPNLKL